MRGLLDRLADGEILLADGAMGTMLFDEGIAPGACPEAVALERPVLLAQIARAYLDAGADLVQTNTFGASPIKLATYGLEGRTEEICRAAVEAVRDAVGDRALVSGSCGPCGAILQPYGDADPAEVAAGFARQLRAMAAAGVDLFCIETMTDLREATIAVEAAREVAPGMPVVTTMTFDATPRGFYTIMGVTVAQAVEGLTASGADVLGTNCGQGTDAMVDVVRAFRELTDRQLAVQPNAGLPELKEGRPFYAEDPTFMATRVPDLIAAGASIVGGCCGTTPAHIEAMRRAIDRVNPRAGVRPGSGLVPG